MYKFFWIFLPTKKVLLFSRVVFSSPFSKNIGDIIRVLEEINWNPRAVNSYHFIHHSADNFTSFLLLVCALMSFEFFIWSSWSFSKILNTIFLDNITMLVERNEILMNWMKCYYELVQFLLIFLCTGFDMAWNAHLEHNSQTLWLKTERNRVDFAVENILDILETILW